MTRRSVISRLLRRGERGQAIWWMLLIFPLFIIGAAIVIDASVWFGHRRVYQKTADASALAGAQELFTRTDTADMTARAEDKAEDWMVRNNAPPAEFVEGYPEVVSDCWGVSSFDGLPDGVIVDVSKDAPLLFMRAFGGVAPFDIGAHARVCLGSPQEAEGMLPFGIPADTSQCFDENAAPKFGERCDIAIRIPKGASGEAQYLVLWDSPGDDPADWTRRCSDKNAQISNPDFVKQVARGAHTWCRVTLPQETCPDDPGTDDTGHCVYSDTGNRAKWALYGLQCRVLGGDAWKDCPPELPGEGQCDALFGADFHTTDGIDQWWEMLYVEALGEGEDPRGITPDSEVTFVRRDCYAPRLVTLIIIDQYAQQGNPPYPIRGFAGFVIEGCRDKDGVFNPWCLVQNQERDYPGRGPYLSDTGHLWMEGFFINYVDVGGQGGPATKYGRMQLYLIE